MFSDANVNITVTQDDFAIKGKAKIDGVAAEVDMSQPIASGTAAGVGQRSVRLVLDDAARKRFGIGLDDVLAGTIEALVSNIPEGQHYDLDLKKARVVHPRPRLVEGHRRPRDAVLRHEAGRWRSHDRQPRP